MEQYRKFIVAAVGVALLLAAQLGVAGAADAEDEVVTLIDAVVGVLTAFGVYRVPNAPPAE